MIPLTPSDIVRQLRLYLPWHSDRFANLLPVGTVLAVAPNSMSVTFLSDPGLEIGDALIVKNMTYQNPIVAALVIDDHGVITLGDEVDVTLPQKPGDPTTIEIGGFTGADVTWNGVKTLIDISQVGTGDPILKFLPKPDTEFPFIHIANQYMEENRPIHRGIWIVSSHISEKIKLLERSDAMPPFGFSGFTNIENLEIYSQSNIVLAPTLERAAQMYTSDAAQDKIWLYVIPGGRRSSRDRNALTDAIAEFNDGDQNLLLLLMTFFTVVFIDTPNSIAAAQALDLVYGDIATALYKSLFGFKPENCGSDSSFAVIPEDDDIALYNTSYYAHSFKWEFAQQIDYTSGFSDPQDFAADKLIYIQHPKDLANPEVLRSEIKTR